MLQFSRFATVASLFALGAACAAHAGQPQSDLEVRIQTFAPVTPGDIMPFVVRVTNNGPAASAAAVLTWVANSGVYAHNVFCSGVPGQCTVRPDLGQLDTGVPVPALAPGEFYAITVDTFVRAENPISVTANVTGAAGAVDPVAANNTAVHTGMVTPSNADLVVSLTDQRTSVEVGGTTQYTVDVRNRGPQPAFGARLRLTNTTGLAVTGVRCSSGCIVPPGVADLQAGVTLPVLVSQSGYALEVTADVTATSGSVSATATVDGASFVSDPVPANNTAVDANTVTGSTSLPLVGPRVIPAGSWPLLVLLATTMLAVGGLVRWRRDPARRG